MKRRSFLQVVSGGLCGLLGDKKITAKTRTGTFPRDWYVDVFCKQVCDYTGYSFVDVDALLRWKFLCAEDETGRREVCDGTEDSLIIKHQFYCDCSRWAKLVLGLDIPSPEWDVLQVLGEALDQRQGLKG